MQIFCLLHAVIRLHKLKVGFFFFFFCQSHDSIARNTIGERRMKTGVMKMCSAASWSSVKQRACSSIWWVSALMPCWDHSFQACRYSGSCSPPAALECSIRRCFRSLRALVRFSSRCCRWRFSSFRVWMVSWSSYAEPQSENREINQSAEATCMMENIVANNKFAAAGHSPAESLCSSTVL